MRCPKCKLITYEGNTRCPRCGEDLSALVEALGPFYKFSTNEIFLKDTLIKPPPFIGAPETPQPSEMPLPPLHEEPPEPETPPLRQEEVSPPPPERREGVLKELEEALEEDQG
ncbi:MAG TPA: hypothetical protein ENJ40_08605 [Thermosulfurimonas dismutans]|uniref:Uncharacterized protein n=1 Tax=Thermosulfurimonas dismutans TaxID=999894 RepID=A0A7C3GIC8_9BACT|nr:hypothetical protein [Thermosulfurimonas dismutans]